MHKFNMARLVDPTHLEVEFDDGQRFVFDVSQYGHQVTATVYANNKKVTLTHSTVLTADELYAIMERSGQSA